MLDKDRVNRDIFAAIKTLIELNARIDEFIEEGTQESLNAVAEKLQATDDVHKILKDDILVALKNIAGENTDIIGEETDNGIKI